MRPLGIIQQREGIIVAVGMIVILGVMLLPLPPIILDMLLSISISLSVMILITSIFVMKPLDFSAFPTILLMATMFRLALNIASTRLILLKGNEGIDAAGKVIMSFGNFVVGGNYIVGLIIFLILIIINFIVITKGAGRIAEVTARFTLDAMPGKQMSIDADLNAGLIDEATARKRREEISHAADFYGAMDGASKFVRGDAIAGLVITAINIIGGLLIGMLQHGMDIAEAANNYTILTVGDGLVSQVPALLVSTSAGILVSRTGKETDISRDITRQLLINPRAIVTTSAILFLLALVPGLPNLMFLLISLVTGGIAYLIIKSPQTVQETEDEDIKAVKEEPKIESFIDLDPLTLEIGYGLIPLVEEGSGDLLNKVKAMRRQIASELGFVVPPIHIKDNLQLRPHEYSFYIRGVEIAKGEVMMGYYLAVPSENADRIDGIPAKEPAFGLPAYWIPEKDIDKVRAAGNIIVDPATVIATHLTELIKKHSWELLTRTETQTLLDNVSKRYPKIVDELIPSHLTLGGVQRVLQNLLREQVPINDLVIILDTLLDYSSNIKDIEILTEYVRQSLARYITRQFSRDGSIYVVTLAPEFDNVLSQAIAAGGTINPDMVNKLINGIEKVITTDSFKGMQPIILCSVNVRRYLRKIMDKFLPSVVVLSNAEITSGVKLYTIGMVRYEDQEV